MGVHVCMCVCACMTTCLCNVCECVHVRGGMWAVMCVCVNVRMCV